MVLRFLSRGAIAALAGAAMLAASTASSPAFTLTSPSLEQPIVGADVDSVYWSHWGGGWHRWGWRGGWGPRYGFAPVYHCWWGPWGRRCGV